jgi:protein SCO1/2
MSVWRICFYLLLVIGVIAAGIALRAVTSHQAPKKNNIAAVTQKSQSTGKPSIGGAYTLVNQNGHVVSDKSYRGKYVLIFFGYTFCPDVCPTTLTTLSTAIDLLGKDAEKIKPLFVTIDPLRDTPGYLKEYLAHFHKSFDGLTGNMQQIKHIKKVFRIYATKAKVDKSDREVYLMNHSSVSYLIGPDGKFLTFFSHGTEAKVIANKLKEFL